MRLTDEQLDLLRKAYHNDVEDVEPTNRATVRMLIAEIQSSRLLIAQREDHLEALFPVQMHQREERLDSQPNDCLKGAP
jgi:hypothetical protein